MNKHFTRAALQRPLEGSLLFARNGLALIGLTVTLAAILMMGAQSLSARFIAHHGSVTPGDEQSGFVLAHFAAPGEAVAQAGVHTDAPAAVDQAPEFDSANMREQLDIARYLARKYHLSQDAMVLMVREAYRTGRESGIEPSLLLAVIAVESGFNPFAESTMGAEGLMQVMAKVHGDKLDASAGPMGVLDPTSNIRVGAIILKDAIRRGGSLRAGLRLYVGSTTDDDGGYGARVLQERDRILFAAKGGNPLIIPAVVAPQVKPTLAPVHADETAAARLEPAVETHPYNPISAS